MHGHHEAIESLRYQRPLKIRIPPDLLAQQIQTQRVKWATAIPKVEQSSLILTLQRPIQE